MGFLGGFFNYDKPGPGIRKDGPQKKGFVIFFETWFRNFWKLITINLVYLLLSVLIIPSGLAEAGMANVCRNLARDKHSFGLSDFFDTIKKNWKQALPAGIVNFIITAMLLFAMFFYYTSEGWIASIALGLAIASFIIFSFMKYYVWLIVITFKLPLSKIYKNCFLFAFVNVKYNLLIGIVSILVCGGLVALALVIPYVIAWLLIGVLFLCVVPGFINLMIQFCIFPTVIKFMIDPYYEAHPGEDIELRRNLGLDIEEEDDEEETVFEDNRLLGEEDTDK